MTNSNYFAEFGEFIHWYSTVERAVHHLFRHSTGMPDDVARTISGGMRLGDLIGMTKRLMMARDVEKTSLKEVERIFTQLGFISQLRDTLIHRGAESIGDLVLSTNYHIAKSMADLEILELHIDDIKAAKRDCAAIFMRIDRVIDPDAGWAKDPAAEEWLRQPWRYKPRQPKRPNQPLRTSGRSRRRRHSSSRA